MKKEQKKRRKKQQQKKQKTTVDQKRKSQQRQNKKSMQSICITCHALPPLTGAAHPHTYIRNDTRAPHRIYHHIQHKHVLRVGSPFGNSDGPQTDTTTKRQHTHNRPCVRYVFIFFLGRSTWLYFSTGISPAIYYCVKEILVSSAKVPTAIRQPRPTDQPSNQASNQPTEAKTNKT